MKLRKGERAVVFFLAFPLNIDLQIILCALLEGIFLC